MHRTDYMLHMKITRIEKTYSVGYEREDIDYGYDDFDEHYPDLESFNLALESARNEDNYLLIANLLMFQTVSDEIDYSVTEYEKWGSLYQEAIDCYKKVNHLIHAAEAMLEYANYKDANDVPESQECKDLILGALSIFEKEKHKDGIVGVARIMHDVQLDVELESLELKHNVQFKDFQFLRSTFTWGFIPSKFAFVILLITLPILEDRFEFNLLLIVFPLLFISVLIADIFIMKMEREKFMAPWDRFFQWIDE